MGIYRRNPVLTRRGDMRPATARRDESKVWPLKYMRMFDMTNDSALFRTRAEWVADGHADAGLNRWHKADSQVVPLYVGRMIHQYDHRHASVTVNDANLHNAASGSALPSDLKVNPAFFPTPQYWIDARAVPEPLRRQWAIGFRDIARATDAAYVLDTFPIVRQQDMAAFGRYRTKDDVLAQLRRAREPG